MLKRLRKFQDRHRNVTLGFHLASGRLYKPSHLNVLVSDLLGKREKQADNPTHCEAAVQWLLRAHERSNRGGVSFGYSFSWGWRWPYPETSGYIISSLLDFREFFPNSPSAGEAYIAAIEIAEWLIKIQLPDGSYNEGLYPINKGTIADKASASTQSTAFETAQAISGLLRIYRDDGKQRYLDAATLGCDWLVKTQSSNGSWSASYQNQPRSFDSYIAWPLVIMGKMSGNRKYYESAIRNLEWCLSQQHKNGFFENCSHSLGQPPLTHGIGYAAQGLFETGLLLDESRYIQAATKTAEVLLSVFNKKGFLPARFDSDWTSKDKFTCLTGNAQASLIWSKLYIRTGETKYLTGARSMNNDLKSLQNLSSANLGIRGGIKGSHPIYGLYITLQYPNWAAKFFIDALVAEERASKMAEKEHWLKNR